MNNQKNVIIGVLVTILVLGLGYMIFRDKSTGVIPLPTDTTNAPANTNTGSVSQQKVDAPTVETGSTVTPSSSTAIVSGKVNPNGASTTYWYEYSESSALGNRTTSQSIGSGFTSITAPGYITGLKANTAYYYRLNAQNKINTVRGTIYSFSTNNTNPTTAAAPTVHTSTADDISTNSVLLKGEVNPKGSNTVYWYEYGIDTNLGNISSFQSAGSGLSSVSAPLVITGLNSLTKYYYRLNAQNQFGTVVGEALGFITRGPAEQPSSPNVNTTSATNIGTGSATLNGTVNPNGAKTVYYFEYSKDSLIGSIIGTKTSEKTLGESAGKTSLSQNINGLSRDTKYYYRLVAKNSEGTGDGDVMSFRTNP